MRRVPGLVELSRRDFCALAAGAVIAGCTSSGPSPVSTGPIGGDDDSPDSSTDEDAAPHGDASHGADGGTPADAAPQPTCPTSGATDVGAPSTFVTGTAVYFSSKKIFVVRDAGGLYALTARCTHEGATCSQQGSNIHCPKHDANFTLNGAVISGPVTQPLVHYAMCTLANGHVGVVTATQVSASERLVT